MSERFGTTTRSFLESLWVLLDTQTGFGAIQQVLSVPVTNRSHSRVTTCSATRWAELVREIPKHHTSPSLTTDKQQGQARDYIRKLSHPRLTDNLTSATLPQWVG
jgi:hypothetical protein